MKTTLIRLTYHDCAARFGLSETEVRDFVDFGLLGTDPAANTILDEPDHLARLARLHHELGLNREGIEVVLAMRQRLLALQQEVQLLRTRARQAEHLLAGPSPSLDADDWLF